MSEAPLMRLATASVLPLAALLCVGLAPAAGPPVPVASAGQLAKLVADLGADDFSTREAAERALEGVGAEAVPALLRGMERADPEIRTRSLALARRAEKRAAAFFRALGGDVQRQNFVTGPRLTAVSFNQRDASRLRDEHLRELIAFPWLKQVRLNDAPVGDVGMKHIGRLTKLDYLVLRGTQVTDAGLAHLAGLTELEVLDLHKTGVTGPGLVHLGAMKRLHTLNIDQSKLTDAGLAAGVSGIKGLENLRFLGLSGTRLGDDGLEASVAGLKNLKKLTYLDVNDTRVTDAGLGCLDRLMQPIGLGLAGTKVTDKGIARLRAVRNMRSLDLSRTAVTDQGCAQLARIKTLEDIGLGRTRVTVAGLRLFKNLPRLKSLSIRGVKLSDKERDGICDLLPKGVIDDIEDLFGPSGQAEQKP
jgi:Leucine Rich repeat